MGNGLNNGDYKKGALFPWESSSKNSDRISAWMVEDTGMQFKGTRKRQLGTHRRKLFTIFRINAE